MNGFDNDFSNVTKNGKSGQVNNNSNNNNNNNNLYEANQPQSNSIGSGHTLLEQQVGFFY